MDAVLKRSTVLVGIAFGFAANAQTPPDAGSLIQQIQQEKKNLPPAQIERPEAAPAPQEMPKPSGVTLDVRDFRFDGNTLLSSETLHAAVAEWTGKQLDFNQLQRVAQIVAETYRKSGWVVRAYLPKQDVTNGLVTIRIVEGKFGKVEIEGEAPKRLKPDVAVALVRGAQTPGAPLNADNVERGVMLVGELPGVLPSASLKAGEQEGQTDVLLKLREGPLVSGDVGADNAGSRSTGAARLTGNLSVNDPLGIGDQVQTNIIHSSGSDYGRLGYSLPLGSNGLRFSAYASALSYSLVGSDFSALDAHGRSNNYGLNLRYPWILSHDTKAFVGLSYDRRRFDNLANGATTSHYGINDLGANLVGSRYDRLMGGGLTSGSITVTHGNTDLNGSPNQSADSVTSQTAGGFNKIQYSLARYQTLGDSMNLNATLTGQSADKNLDSAEKFYLGGIGGVRAYPANEGGGSSGQIVNLELRRRVTPSLTAMAFYDWGHVKMNENNNFPGAQSLNAYSLKGAGLGLIWTSSSGISLTAEWARRIGSNPNPAANGKDQDGSLDKNRIWLVLGVPFGFDAPTRSTTTLSRAAPTPEPAVAAAPATPVPPVEASAPVAVDAVPTPVPAPAVVAQATAPIASATPVEDVQRLVETWRSAWESGDVQAYLNAYAEDFKPAGGLTREQWQAQRKQRIHDAKSIHVDVSDLQVKVDGDAATAQFVQHYRASNYADTVRKTLALKRVDGGWVIVSEKQETMR